MYMTIWKNEERCFSTAIALNFIVLAFSAAYLTEVPHVGEYLYRVQPEELYEGEMSGEGDEQPAGEMISNELSGLDGLD